MRLLKFFTKPGAAPSPATLAAKPSNVHVAPRLPDEDYTKDMDFNTSPIHMRRQAGLSDARRTIARQAWLAPVGPMGPMGGLVVHDLARED